MLGRQLLKLSRFNPFKPNSHRKFHLSSTRFGVLDCAPNAQLSKALYDRYMHIPLPECRIQAKYVWIDGTGEHVRSKTRTLDGVPQCVEEVPRWAFDGSSTFFAHVENSDCILVPVVLYPDPIRLGNHLIVLCETLDFEEKPTKSNHRHVCVEAMKQVEDQDVMVGFEQEYTMLGVDGRPFGWPVTGDSKPAGFFYCSVGGDKVYGRVINEALYRCALYSGIDIFGTNTEVMLSQWEFQIGTCPGLKGADDVWMCRFLLERISEDFGVNISYHPKLYPHWAGSGMHTNLSTKAMREEGGLKLIEEACKKLEKRHMEHMKVYDPAGGAYNRMRLTGKNETAPFEKFTWAIASRAASVRISRNVALKKKGFFEDRRPASNADPYALLNAIVRTTLLDEGC